MRERLGRKEYDLALADAEKAIQMDNKDGDTYQVRSYIKGWLNDRAGACSDIKEAKSLGIKRVTDDKAKDAPIDQIIKEFCA